MSAPASTSTAIDDAQEAAEALTLLDALARAPAAAALVVAALQGGCKDWAGFRENRDVKALRLVHTQLRDAVGEATTEGALRCRAPADAAALAAPRGAAHYQLRRGGPRGAGS